MKRILALAVSVLMAAAPAALADGKAVVDGAKCGDCHKMAGPAAKTIAEVLQRKAPDLFYAGSKFKKEWLVKYIQNPTTLRPGGTVYINNVTTEGEQDMVKNPPKCAAKLSAGDAAAAADYLMTLTDASMKAGVFKEGKIKKAKARVVMQKEEACNACHILGGSGGISCPTLDGANERLNPDWVYSFIQNPQHWDPKVWMAKRDFDDATLQLMVNYLMQAD